MKFIYLDKKAQFDHLAAIPDGGDRAAAIIAAMESIEKTYPSLKGSLPKQEYQELAGEDLGQLLRTFADPELEDADGDVFGRIYEYFLTQFADQKAHDGGEFFTPPSLVQTIVNVIEPDHGKIVDAACGSGGMFVQSAHFIERQKENPSEKVTFYGMEKNPTTIRLAKMNLAVHGLEGDIQKAITYYEDPHKREAMVLSGDVDIMISIKSGFFYTRTVPCELWFLDKDKPADRKDKVLMLDARQIFRKVTRAVYDFSPEQMKNLTAIVWLYRGEKERFACARLPHHGTNRGEDGKI